MKRFADDSKMPRLVRPPKIAVVMPALNEEDVIANAVEAIPHEIVSEIIVVDNGSTDRTAERAAAAGAQVVVEPHRGYGRACLAGTRSVSSDCDIIVLMDADLSDDPSEISMLIRPIVEEDFELVLGSRLLGKREKGSLTPVQVFGSFVASLMIRAIFGVRYTDMGPFRAIKRTTLESLEMREATYGWSIEMQTKAAARKLRMKEVPVSWRNRAGGESKVAGTINGSIRAGFRIVMTILRTAISEAKG